MPSNRYLPLLNFNDAVVGTDGIIIKAGCQDSDADANGLGVGRVITETGSPLNFDSGGVSTDGANTNTTVRIPIPAAYQKTLRGSGRLQFDILAEDLYKMVTQNNGKISLRNAADTDADGPRVQFNGGTGRGGTDFASRMVNNLNYGVLALDASWAIQRRAADDNNSQGAICIAGETGWVTVTVSWTPNIVTWLQGVDTVTRTGHATPSADLTNLRIELIATEADDRLPIRNILLCEYPAPDTHNSIIGNSVPFVVVTGHSFNTYDGGLAEDGYDTTKRIGCVKHLISNAHHQYTKRYGPLRMKNVGHDGSVRTAATVITGHAETMTDKTNTSYNWADAAGDVIKNRVLGQRPDIVTLQSHGSDAASGAGAAVVDSQLTLILDALKADGVIPIVIREQNRDAGSTPKDNTVLDTQVQATVAAWRAANGGDNACQIVDLWTPTGGENVNTDYVENTGSLIHPSYDVGELSGILIAEAIRAAVLNPPSWSRWALR